jgi:alanine racemase
MLEGIFSGEDLEPAQALNLSLVLHNCEQVRMLAKTTIRIPLSIYMKLDTGMHRLGFVPEAYLEAFQQLQTLQRAGKVAQISHMTHFACADQPEGIVQPLAQFQAVLAGLPGHWSLSNSAACLRHAQTIGRCVSEQQRQSWSRPGICLYGASPFDDRRADQMGFRPTMTLRSQLISVKAVASGEGIGYGHVFIAPCDMRIGVVACGYADGYPRHAPTGTPVDVAGVRTSIIGRISMDMMMVDLSHHPGAAVGDEVVLWGEGGPGVDDVARSAGTIGYELLTAVTSRVARSVAA